MNSASILFSAFLLQFHVVNGNELTKSSWADLEIANKIAGGMPYKDFIVDIYELKRNATQLDNKKTYAYTPVAELDHRSGVCRHNSFSGNYEVIFSIRFWNDRLQNDVVSFLQKEVSADIKTSDVSVIHFDKVMLTSSFSSKPYQIQSEWQNYRKNQVVRFKLICTSRQNCDQTVKLMHNEPGLFDHLRLQLSVSSKTSRTRAVRITAEAISQGKFLSQLIQRFPDNDEVLLTAEDANRLISETAANVALEIVDDTGLVNPKSAIYKQLEQIFIESHVVSSQLDKTFWNSVFWTEEKYRPDRTSQTITSVYKKSDNDSKKHIKDYLNPDDEVEENIEFADVGFSFKNGFKRQNITNKQAEKEEMLKILTEAKGRVEWVKDRFEPKPAPLSKVNMAILRAKTEFKEVETSITYATAGLSMDVVIDEQLEVTEDRLAALESKVRNLMTTQHQMGTRDDQLGVLESQVQQLLASEEQRRRTDDQLAAIESKVQQLTTVQNQLLIYVTDLNIKMRKIEENILGVPENIEKLQDEQRKYVVRTDIIWDKLKL